MERRSALKGLASGVGALFVLPAWANGWNESDLNNSSLLSDNELSVLELVCDALLPETGSYPGAKSLKVHLFVEKMIADCYDAKTQENVKKSLSWLNKQSENVFGIPFKTANGKQRLNLLESAEVSNSADLTDFFKLIKGLSVQGYTSSEYYLTKVVGYELVPGRFNGCKTI